VPHLPTDYPRYLMGVGKPDDIVEAVRRGIDMFDCVLPTRSGRTGQAFTLEGPINIRNARFADDPAALDEGSDCPASRDYSRAYLHHLFKAKEMLGSTLLSWHNVSFYQRLMADLRAAIDQGRLEAFCAAFQGEYRVGEDETS
jgi:queuine tRNA-ribosyltransferase